MGSRGPQAKQRSAKEVKLGLDAGKRAKKREGEEADRLKKLGEGLTDAQKPFYIPVMPDYLIPEAVEHWNVLIPQLVKAKFCRAADADILAQYCQVMGRVMSYERSLKETGEFVQKTKVTRTLRPEVKLLREYRKEAREIAAAIGLTPKARQAMNLVLEPPPAVSQSAETTKVQSIFQAPERKGLRA